MMVLSDLKYAIRLLSKSPGFTILTTIVMAAGIGLSIYLFSFFNTMVFKEMPFEDGDSLVQLSSSQNGVRNAGPINLHDYQEIRTNLKGLSEFGAYSVSNLNVSGRDGARRYSAVAAEPNIFQLTRTKPILGREFTKAENQAGAERVVVIGYDMWQNQFGGDPKIIDQTLRISGISHRIIGVMPAGYVFPTNTELWTPLREDATQLTRGNSGDVIGLAHIQDGVSMEELNRQLALVMQRIEQKYPKTNNGIGAYISTIPLAGDADTVAVIYSVHIIAILILILASVNVGNLLLSRAVERGKETAIRVALGAPRSRLISQMLWESIIICTVGGIVGLLVLAWGLEATQAITKTFFVDKPPFWWQFGIDAFTIKLFFIFVVGTILITGLLPAWKNSGADFNAVLRDGTRGALSKKSGRLNRFLIISQIFVSLTVLIAATVMMVGNFKATRADYGAKTENILTAAVLLTESKYDTPEKQAQFAKALQSRLENTVGIGDVMIASALPGSYTSTPALALEGREYTEDKGYPRANYIVVTPGSLAKLGVELKKGRYFNTSDEGLGKGSVIVTDSFVARHFPNESPIGKRIRTVELDGDQPNWLTIVGVVEHTIQGASYEESGKAPSVFRPFAQSPRTQMTVAMEMKLDSDKVIRTLRKTLESIDPELPAFRVEAYAESFTRHTGPMLFITSVFLLFGIAAIVLATSGIYGVMSNTINQRTQEIGVKRALGAVEQRITKEFLMSGVKQLLWGGIPGLLAGCGMGFAMSSMLGVGNADLLLVSLSLVLIIGGTVLMATYLPTKRALQMEPSQALRHE
ncbi:ADOP family duplicated permease [Aliikangiella coralliicola]|uniref:FtsX-like permease family protein n=1 Tax=Aliikangiella coralliicola TaxID=2592383 RepID=A0A545U972_9GAMM|nr:ADOP family duplicated permease [Aliikangiella coralliicola]TQV86014.1 FtsX-like permease family protein [Aliikangiella coralliicola]